MLRMISLLDDINSRVVEAFRERVHQPTSCCVLCIVCSAGRQAGHRRGCLYKQATVLLRFRIDLLSNSGLSIQRITRAKLERYINHYLTQPLVQEAYHLPIKSLK